MKKRLLTAMAAIFIIAGTINCSSRSDDKNKDHHNKPEIPIDVITGVLTIKVDDSSPSSKIITGGQQKETVATFNLAASDDEDLEINEFVVTDISPTLTTLAQTWYLYSNQRADGLEITNPVATFVGDKAAKFTLTTGTIIIPAGGNLILTVKIDVVLVEPSQNGSNFMVATLFNDEDIVVTGLTSNEILKDSIATGPLVTAEHVGYATQPVFMLNANSPSGIMLSPSIESLIAIFNVAADAGGDVTFSNANGNYLAMEIFSECSTNSADEVLTLKDETNTVLSVAGPINICGWKTIKFFFETQDLTILHGTTKKIHIYADTTEFLSGDTVQTWFSDEYPDNIDWGIDGIGNYNEAVSIFRGNLYGNTLSIP